MTRKQPLAAAFEAFTALFVLFLLHRLLSFGLLAGKLHLGSVAGGKALLVGLMSDVWIACLGSILVLGLSAALAKLPRLERGLRLLLLLAFGVAAAGHQAYVEFYHFQIIPFHLRYLTDRSFLAANSASMLTARPLALLAAYVLGLTALLIANFFRETRRRALAWSFTGLTVLGLLCHNRAIHYRVQWFIPANLQSNAIERLYREYQIARLPPPLVDRDVRELAALLDEPAIPGAAAAVTSARLYTVLTRPVRADAAVRPVAAALRQAFAEDVHAKFRPIIMTILLESLRPSETGYFAPSQGQSLTPTLDQLAAHGIVFMHAYSTGSVTRGAQEAVLCGYRGSRDTSLMRGNAIVNIPCLPDMIRGSHQGETFWYHGGDPRFDGQLDFWTGHGITHFLSLPDFAPGTPRSGWGVGDRSFFQTATARLVELHARSHADYLYGLGLTVTNHIPWDLPSDAVNHAPPRAGRHPSYLTTFYSDAALGSFIQALKAAGLWPHMLLMIASDHGNTVPPLVNLYGNSPMASHLRECHVNMLLTGGLTERALKATQSPPLRIDDVVSQAGLATLAAYVMNLDGARFMGDNPLGTHPKLPVLSDLEEDLFDPVAGQAYSRREIVGGDVESLPTTKRRDLLYYRAFLQFINSASKGNQ